VRIRYLPSVWRSRPRFWAAAALATAVLGTLTALRSQAAMAPAPQRLCAHYGGVPDGFVTQANAGMVWIAGGDLMPGSQRGYPEERGGSRVRVAGFWIDRTEVSNAQFARFVQATGYVTLAEREGQAPVFHKPSLDELAANGEYAWWQLTAGASWRHPEGPSSDALQLPNHPVVQVAHADALAYARWLGHALPSELQWEYAAKAGRDSEALHREPRDAHGQPSANFWQGDFPTQNSRQDGFETSAPVGCFAPNPWGLFDMLGNVWEWTGAQYTSSHRADQAAPEEAAAHGGSSAACSSQPASGARLVIKGGSFLCSANFCARYRVAARHAQEAEQPAMHIGFRTVLSEGATRSWLGIH
jgi:sulfatase modifying factor 1